MGKFIVTGGNRLEGEVRVHGAKNAVLPILAASILNNKTSVIHDCPDIKDVDTMIAILIRLGCHVKKEGNTLTIDSSKMDQVKVPEDLMREMRSSIIFLGSILSRQGEVIVSYPGGCSIGHRPIDLHLSALRQLGVEVIEEQGYISCKATRIRGNRIYLDFPSVGATENIMLAAVKGEGTTIIDNPAKEPEIIDLQNFLNSMGAHIRGAGTNRITIYGVKELCSTEYTVIPDRIVAGTYLMAAAITGSELTVSNVEKEHMYAILAKLREMGCSIRCPGRRILISSPQVLKPVEKIITHTYPGYPTDMQAQTMAALTVTSGVSIIKENIFEFRYKHAEELIRMGAKIQIEGKRAIIHGVESLYGTEVIAKDLRGGAALIIAGLQAKGVTTVKDSLHVERGYEDIARDLSCIGANIKYVPDTVEGIA